MLGKIIFQCTFRWGRAIPQYYPTFQDDEDRPLALKKKKKRLMADITELIQLSDSDEAGEGEDDNFNDAVAANIDPDPLTLKRFDIRVDYSEFETGFLATLPKAKIRLSRIQTPTPGMVVEKILLCLHMMNMN